MSGCEDGGEYAEEEAASDEATIDWSSRIATDEATTDADSAPGDDTDANADLDDPDDLDDLEAALREHGVFEWLDLHIETVEPGRVVFELPFDDKFANLVSGTVHGGITATVIDTASGFALRSTFENPEAAQLTTTDLNVRYLRPARDDLRVEAEVVRAGGSMGVTDCEVTTVHDGDRTIVATGGTSYRLFRE